MSVHFPVTHRRYMHYRKKDDFVVVKYGAEWCGPCKKISPLIAELAAKYKNVYFKKSKQKRISYCCLLIKFLLSSMLTSKFLINIFDLFKEIKLVHANKFIKIYSRNILNFNNKFFISIEFLNKFKRFMRLLFLLLMKSSHYLNIFH